MGHLTNGDLEGIEAFPDIAEMNVQIYQILCDSYMPKTPAHNKLMALERREKVRGLYAYWDFSRELAGQTRRPSEFVFRRRPWIGTTWTCG